MLETERLLLRPFREGDAEDVFAYLKEPTVHCLLDMKLDSLEEAQGEMIRRARFPEDWLAIVLKEDGGVIGEIAGEREKIDTFCLQWMLHADFQHKGYAFEAATAFFEYLFRTLGARRLYTNVEDYNLPSRHLCERLGMRKEALRLEYASYVSDAGGSPIFENSMIYAILKKEWDARR